MRMIVAGGGTGGHLFPGLAVAQALSAKGAAILFVGSAFGIEATAVPRGGFAFEPLTIRGVRGRGARGVMQFAIEAPRALLRASALIRRFRPRLVLGLGGYGSVPVVIAARVHGVPSVLLEQNAHPGLANRLLARIAARICTTFADSRHWFPAGRVVHTGNPVRRLDAAPQTQPRHFTIFIFGGSQGAHTINCAMVDAVPRLREAVPGVRVIHQTGDADAGWVAERYRQAGIEVEVVPFVHDMAAAYARADLVVCRAGATTLAELAVLGKPAILVPYPFAADDHQRANADVVQRAGAAEMILNAELTGERLAASIQRLAQAREQLAAMAAAARRLAMADATERVVRVCEAVAAEGEVTR